MNFLFNTNYIYIVYAVIFIAVFNGVLLLLKVKIQSIVFANVLLLFIACIEPSPSDILFISIMFFAVKDKIITLEKLKKQRMIFILLSGYILLSILSSINMLNLKVGAAFFIITLYLILYSIIIYFYSSDKNFLIIQRAYILGTSISAILGILGCTGFFSSYLCYDMLRVKGLFKDPNVFGPSFIPSVFMLIGDIKSRRLVEGLTNKSIRFFKKNISADASFISILIIINLTGLILSYSRGAYFSFLVGLIILFVLNIKKVNLKKIAAYGVIIMSIAAIVCFGIMNTRTRLFIIDRMKIQEYDLGRFDAQRAGLSLAPDHIAGYGPGQYETAVKNVMGVSYSAHSLYARVLLENGVLGFLLLMSAILILLIRLLRIKRYEDDDALIKSSVLIAAIVSVMVNSIIVDTLHWRHLWLLLGLSLSVTLKYCELGLQEFSGIIRPVYQQGSIKINVISDIEELNKYSDEWYDLLNDDRCVPFIELDFITNWWKFFKKEKQLFILKISKADKTIGFCPLIIEKKDFGNAVKFAGSPQANYMDFIIDDANRKKAIECIMEFLTKQKIIFDLSGIPKNSKNYKAILKYLDNNKKKYFTAEEKAPFIKIDTKKFEDYYRQRFDSHLRKEIKRRENKLANIGKLAYESIDIKKIDEIFYMHKKRWSKKLDKSKFTDENTKKFFTHLAQTSNLSFKTCIDSIKLNGKVIAYKYGFEGRQRYVSYRICHDDDFALFGPGKIITKKKIEECFNKGLALYDFGPGDSTFKAEWTDDYTNIARIIFAGRGFLSNTAYIGRLLKYKIKLILKRNRLIVDFKEKKLGVLIYSLSAENLLDLYKNLYSKVSRSGLFIFTKMLLIRIKKEIYFDENYIIFNRNLTAEEGNKKIEKPGYVFSDFDFNDIDELSRAMRLPKDVIVKRLFNNNKCFTAKKENKIVYYGWVDFSKMEIKEIKFNMALNKKSAYLYDGFTDPEYRNIGLSKQGLDYIFRYLANHNYDKCYIASKESNIPSVKSIGNAGFLPEKKLRVIKIMNKIKYPSTN